MDKKQQAGLLALNTEFAAIASEAHYVDRIMTTPSNTGGGRTTLIFDPAELYARAAAKMLGSAATDTNSPAITAADIARSIRMEAAKIRAGDLTYIFESLTGKAVWLQSLALRLSDYASGVQDPRRKATLGHLLLKMEVTAAKILSSLAAVSCLESGRRP